MFKIKMNLIIDNGLLYIEILYFGNFSCLDLIYMLNIGFFLIVYMVIVNFLVEYLIILYC